MYLVLYWNSLIIYKHTIPFLVPLMQVNLKGKFIIIFTYSHAHSKLFASSITGIGQNCILELCNSLYLLWSISDNLKYRFLNFHYFYFSVVRIIRFYTKIKKSNFEQNSICSSMLLYINSLYWSFSLYPLYVLIQLVSNIYAHQSLNQYIKNIKDYQILFVVVKHISLRC